MNASSVMPLTPEEQPKARTRPSAQDRQRWLEQVGEHTEKHRERRAQAADCKAKAARRRGDRSRERYWIARAEGQRTRVSRVRECNKGLGTVRTVCRGCGCVHEHQAKCSAHLLCVPCRKRKGKRARKRFLLARSAALQNALRKGLMRKQRRGGAYSEKLLTLTVPHQGLDLRERIELMQLAWPKFLKAFRRMLEDVGAKRDSVFYAVSEWAAAQSDDDGHPHRHIYLLCPWLLRERLVELWKRALANAGYRWELGEQPILDVRRVKPDEVAKELIKYLTKDLVADGQLIPPAVFAQVYEMYDGKRRFQGSRGFMSCVLQAPCADCGERPGYLVEFVKPIVEASPDNVVPFRRGPP